MVLPVNVRFAWRSLSLKVITRGTHRWCAPLEARFQTGAIFLAKQIEKEGKSLNDVTPVLHALRRPLQADG